MIYDLLTAVAVIVSVLYSLMAFSKIKCTGDYSYRFGRTPAIIIEMSVSALVNFAFMRIFSVNLLSLVLQAVNLAVIMGVTKIKFKRALLLSNIYIFIITLSKLTTTWVFGLLNIRAYMPRLILSYTMSVISLQLLHIFTSKRPFNKKHVTVAAVVLLIFNISQWEFFTFGHDSPLFSLLTGVAILISLIYLLWDTSDVTFQFFKSQSRQLDQFKAFRHDYKNRLAGLKYLLENQQHQKAMDYLDSMTDKLDSIKNGSVSYSNNTLVDAVLVNLAEKCKAQGVEFDGSVIIGDELPLSDLDLYTLFANLADNAYEAVTKDYDGHKFVKFFTSRREKWLTITAENSYNGELSKNDDGEISTTKTDEENHGIGLKNIQAILAGVDGEMKITTECGEKGNIFTIALIFKRNSKE